jgi:hypothetical protein
MPLRQDQINKGEGWDSDGQDVRNASKIELQEPGTSPNHGWELTVNAVGGLQTKTTDANQDSPVVTVDQEFLNKNGKMHFSRLQNPGAGQVGNVLGVLPGGAFGLTTPSGGAGTSADLIAEQNQYRTLMENWPFEYATFDLCDVSGTVVTPGVGVTHNINTSNYSVANGQDVTTLNLITVAGTYSSFAFALDTSTNPDGTGNAVPFTLEYSLDNFATAGVAFLEETEVQVPGGFSDLYIRINFTGSGYLNSIGAFYNNIGTNPGETAQGLIFTGTASEVIATTQGNTYFSAVSGVGTQTIPANFLQEGTRIRAFMQWNTQFGLPNPAGLQQFFSFNEAPSGSGFIPGDDIVREAGTIYNMSIDLVCSKSGVTGELRGSIATGINFGTEDTALFNYEEVIDTTVDLELKPGFKRNAEGSPENITLTDFYISLTQPKGFAGLVSLPAPGGTGGVGIQKEGTPVVSPASDINFGPEFVITDEGSDVAGVALSNGFSNPYARTKSVITVGSSPPNNYKYLAATDGVVILRGNPGSHTSYVYMPPIATISKGWSVIIIREMSPSINTSTLSTTTSGTSEPGLTGAAGFIPDIAVIGTNGQGNFDGAGYENVRFSSHILVSSGDPGVHGHKLFRSVTIYWDGTQFCIGEASYI